MSYDLVIRNGTVVDGSGLGSYRADVGVVGDRIAFVGRDPRDRDAARSTPRATWSRPASSTATPTWTPRCSGTPSGRSSCWHGVTSAVMGNCGFTLAPVRADQRALVVRNLERAEDIDPAALAAGIDWTLRDLPRVPRRRRPARPRGSTSPPRSGTPPCAPGPWASGPSRRRPPRTTSPPCAASWPSRCGPGPSASPPRAPSTTRPPTTGRSPPAWPPGTRWRRSSG